MFHLVMDRLLFICLHDSMSSMICESQVIMSKVSFAITCAVFTFLLVEKFLFLESSLFSHYL